MSPRRALATEWTGREEEWRGTEKERRGARGEGGRKSLLSLPLRVATFLRGTSSTLAAEEESWDTG